MAINFDLQPFFFSLFTGNLLAQLNNNGKCYFLQPFIEIVDKSIFSQVFLFPILTGGVRLIPHMPPIIKTLETLITTAQTDFSLFIYINH